MPSKRIDELDARVVADADLLPVTPSGGPSGKATVAAIVAEGLSQPNSASSGAGATLSIIAADGVTSGAGGSIILEPGAQATTGGNGFVIVRQPGGASGKDLSLYHDGTNASIVANAGSLRLFQAGNRIMYTGNGFVTFAGGYLGNDDWILMGGGNANGISILNGQLSASVNKGILPVANSAYDTTVGASFAFVPSTPAAIVANQNNYVLTGSAFQRLNCTTASDITGIAPPTGGSHFAGRSIRLVSVGTATVRLMHNSASSTAANRMYMHSGTHVSLTVNEWADLVYDSTDNGSGAAGWRVVKYA
jgi:hypothetical protein